MQKLEPRRHLKFNFDAWARRAWRLSLFVLAAFCIPFGAHAQERPIPPLPERWVTDSAGLLSKEARVRLDGKLESYERQTGHQVVVWIGDTIGATPLDDFAVKTFKAWQLGRKGSDDGVLLLVVANPFSSR